MADSRPLPDNDTLELPPSYDEALQSEYLQGGTGVTDDGRVNLDADSRFFRTLSRFVPDFKIPPTENPDEAGPSQPTQPPSYSDNETVVPKIKSGHWNVRLNIVIQIVGSRGDVQPFVAIGNELQNWGHRVRLATHNVFERFVTESGLEFFPIGGDPSALMAYMVKNPGLIPNMGSLRLKEIQDKRKMVAEMLDGCWRSCIDPDPRTGKPFVADAIIANPPSFAHVHCSQALGIPLHMIFTMPWSTTRAFPHPLANISAPKTESGTQGVSNFVSYSMVEWMTWNGLGDVINDWRKALDLEPVPLSEGPGIIETLRIPFTYCWSPSLLPKPEDWDEHLDVSGFIFREPPEYTPPSELVAFLDQGPAPIYIGFGSIVMDDPSKVTGIILSAIESTGVRAIISKGWGGLGEEESREGIYYIEDCPHEWLFQHVAAVIHHGGAGTTACGLKCGRPTAIVSFFGDQPFWGHIVAAANAGPPPTPFKALNSDNLAAAIRFCLREDIRVSAQQIAMKMNQESGVRRAVQAFHAHLPIADLPCDILDDRPAVWTYKLKGRKGKHVKLSGMAAEILIDHLKVDPKKLHLHVSSPILIQNQRWDPITGTASAAVATYYGMFSSVANIFIKPVKAYRSAIAEETPKSDEHTAVQASSSSSSIKSTADGVTPMSPPLLHRSVSATNLSLRSSSGTQSDKQSTRSHARGAKIAGSMALASASGVGGFFKHYSKGVFVDIPLAFAEGSRALPKLYGEQVRDYGTVTDWKSGLVVSGKSLVLGIGEGFADLAVKPIEGTIQSGVTGGVLGLAKGFIGFSTKVSSAAFGTVAYPSLGIYRSLRTALKTKTRTSIMKARRQESKQSLSDLRSSGSPKFAEEDIIVAFDQQLDH
ncbi:hypothetical protein BGZ61DRAFT_465799 [Ilyonectria robusta]|uniref:uncharacterized protein n=1 Tax=Ilyonectria robusta TaxID=1079257 RepID=UPI001E8CCCE1|nr:uncharacterized protein BGZ61DRAFT_465799 [Ilyonectria robusta]KAH8658577.1 hypothetical protein BGZ61DRAFT_465799 [Ilyonectria robusta]